MLSFGQTGKEDAVLNYTPQVFNSDTCCWRKLSASHQYTDAGNLIVKYIHRHHKDANIHALNWHAGQVYAMAGNNKQAIRYFKKTYNIFYAWFGGEDGKAWYLYAKGTVAFIEKDQSTLTRMMKKWDKKLPKDKNYQGLVLLAENWGKTYLEATGSH